MSTILGIDTSGPVAGVALIRDDILAGEYNIEYEKKHSTTLLPMLDEMGRMLELDLDSVDAVAVTYGPGSFTGIRIGAGAVKGLCYALDKPVVPVPTLMALAYNYCGSADVICPLMDARREQVYNGIYTFENGKVLVLRDQDALPVTDVIKAVNETGRRTVFLGDGVKPYRDIIESNVTTEYMFAPPHLNHQRASSVAELGRQYFEGGIYVDAADFTPEYLRKSQAERERERSENDQ